MTVSVVALGGDGTGPEVLEHSLKVLRVIGEWSGIDFQVEPIECGGQYYLKHGRDWPAGSEQRCSDADVILLGAVGWPAPDGSGPVTMSNGKMAGWSQAIWRGAMKMVFSILLIKPATASRHRIM